MSEKISQEKMMEFVQEIDRVHEKYNMESYVVVAKHKMENFGGRKLIMLHPDEIKLTAVMGAFMYDCKDLRQMFFKMIKAYNTHCANHGVGNDNQIVFSSLIETASKNETGN